MSACKGMNCGCTDGVSHSVECRAEYQAVLDRLTAEHERLGLYEDAPTVTVTATHARGGSEC
jgi:hypothetical protein